MVWNLASSNMDWLSSAALSTDVSRVSSALIRLFRSEHFRFSRILPRFSGALWAGTLFDWTDESGSVECCIGFGASLAIRSILDSFSMNPIGSARVDAVRLDGSESKDSQPFVTAFCVLF